jgi:hypothetical protein
LASRNARVLILCKTYPSPSGKHIETSCVAGMEENGELIRLFPVPFRLIGDEKQFKKWQWIKLRIDRAKGDNRPESHKVFVDTIELEGSPVSSDKKWIERRKLIEGIKIFSDFAELESFRQYYKKTLGFVRPKKIIGLDITPVPKSDWSDEEKAKLLKHQQQVGLFDENDSKSISLLRKLPFDFHYRYICDNETKIYRHKIADWEAGALYWTCYNKYGGAWEAKFREKMEQILPSSDLMFLMGTIHRFPDQWLIVSLIYPPKLQQENDVQGSLLL